MGQISAGVTWPVWTRAGSWDDCWDKPCKHKKCNTLMGQAMACIL